MPWVKIDCVQIRLTCLVKHRRRANFCPFSSYLLYILTSYLCYLCWVKHCHLTVSVADKPSGAAWKSLLRDTEFHYGLQGNRPSLKSKTEKYPYYLSEFGFNSDSYSSCYTWAYSWYYFVRQSKGNNHK